MAIHKRSSFVREPTVQKWIAGDTVLSYGDKMKEILKEIKEYKNYYISNLGNVYSTKSGKLIKLTPYIDSKGNYLMIRLIRNDGIRKSLLIHRLVAEHFIPNPLKLPEVNHKDKNTKNPKVDNLEWCTRKENLYDSYSTMSPVKNLLQNMQRRTSRLAKVL